MTHTTASSQPLFLRACFGKPVERTPCWLMRQAGRYMPEYRALRAEHGFWTLCRTPELAARVTLQPVNRFHTDAAILFSDILVLLPAMGREVDFAPAPVLAHPVRSRTDIDSLALPDMPAQLGYVAEAIRQCRAQLPATVPLIGFSGAPLTLAAYLVEGGGSRHFAHLKQLLRDHPDDATALLSHLAQVVAAYLKMQIDAGAQAVQLFDTWAGSLPRDLIQRFVIPHVTRIIQDIRTEGVPVIYFMKDAAHVHDLLAATGADVISCDERTPLSQVAQRIGAGPALQGNFDPIALLGSRETITAEVQRIVDDFPKGLGHIFNLGHGVVPETPEENVAHLLAEVARLSRQKFAEPR
ncbi:MAG: uroporphyrinogen decarboxylase [Myxococcales bacterium]|jgi:uroporphyrinogen decarboxylase|nr:uroporphyrinogen decarboxylase [Myxococcales bacterium]